MVALTATEAPFLVIGGTGNVGREVIAALLAAGEPVRAAVRNDAAAARLPPGAEAVRLDLEDSATFEAALAGVRGLFLMRPPLIVRVKSTLNRFLDAAEAAGVGHCVFLSVAGAETNKMVPHHGTEKRLMEGSTPWTILRPGFFAQNLTGPYREDIREGRIVLPAGNGEVAFVDAKDLGAVAAAVLREPLAHAGQAYHLTGPQAVTFDQVAAMLTEALGRPVVYEAASIPGYWRHVRRRGVSRVQAAVYTVLHVGLRKGQGAAVDPTIAQLLGRPARAMPQFIADNLSAWR